MADRKSGIYLYYQEDIAPQTPYTASQDPTPSRQESILTINQPRPPRETGLRTNFTNSFSDDTIVCDLRSEPTPTMHDSFDAGKVYGISTSLLIIVAAGLGVGVGFGLGKLGISPSIMEWVALPGTLFLRALRCLVVPFVFSTLSVSVAEIIALNKKSLMTWQTAGTFFLTSVLSSLQGFVVTLVYKYLSAGTDASIASHANKNLSVALQCPNGLYLGTHPNGTVSCFMESAVGANFVLDDINGVLSTSSTTTNTTSVTSQILSIFNQLVPDNIFTAMDQGTILSITAFALPFGYAVAKSHSSDFEANTLLNVLRQTRGSILVLIYIVLRTIPIAVFCLVAEAMVSYTANTSQFASHAGFVFVAFMCGVISHTMIVLPLVVYLFTHTNPYTFMKQLLPVYAFGFGCASPLATLPVAITVVSQTRLVSYSATQLIMCLGTPVNTNASGLFHPLMVVFMTNMDGMSDALGTPQLVVLFFAGVIGALSTAPVVGSPLIVLLTVWKTVFPNAPVPQSYAYVVAMDFVFSRIRTMVNVNGNMMVTRILGEEFSTLTPVRQQYTTPTPERRLSRPLDAVSANSSNSRRVPQAVENGLRTDFKTTPQRDASLPATPPISGRDFQGDPIMEEEAHNNAMHPTYQKHTSGFSSSLAILICAIIGIGLGIGLGKTNPSADTQALVALPGNLFVRCLKCLIVPLVFCTMTVSVAEVIELKRTSLLTWRTAGLFFFTSFLSACQGMTLALVYRGVINHGIENIDTSNSSFPVVAFKCANGLFLHAGDDGSLACLDKTNATIANDFSLIDVNNALNLASANTTLSVTDQAISIVNQAVPDNIFSALSQGTLLSVIAFALPLGFAVALSHNGRNGPNQLLEFTRQVRNALLILVTAVLRFTPIAVLFLIADAVATYTATASQFASQAGYAVLFFFCGVFSHVGIVLPLVMVVFIRINPYTYMRQLLPAYVFAFGCSSSMATLPVAVTVIHQTRKVTRSTAQLIMCLGTPTNMNSAGLYHPLMVVFMAQISGHGSDLTTPKLVILFFISLLGSMGTAPVPNAGLIMLITVWKTVFPNIPLPHSFVYVVAMDFLLGRVRVMVNVNGNMMATRILANNLDDTSTDEEYCYN
ncbi:dicarboxylate/amino acid:cation (Na or H) symporter (DAACS) family protein [Thraustotheca clavata]|uniref:Dicarboxylate/amino acid:cation (Na or H) symporter (DAACS) family protein n=1 Tax=Thraustotheca clavata TaxID=74557 RepID=A0A1V9ZPA3_9STRA|nr:dicarboxylate/amino acid:cation (Na or H) symporter (DAACS) family protein [Thraustotheca clavata]